MKKIILMLALGGLAQAEDFRYDDAARCHSDGLPVLPLLVASGHENRDLVRAALEEALARGCDLNEARPDDGLNALNTAILLRETEWLQFLRQQGANPELRIDFPARPYHGLNSYEWARFLYEHSQNPLYRDLEALL